MRHVARRGDGIPATKHCGAYRREDGGSGGAGSVREAEPPSTAPNSRGCQAWPRFGSGNRRKTRSVLRGEAEGRAESPQKQGFETKPQFRGAERNGPKQGEASYAGLAPEAVYVYGERGEGRANRPPCTGSTVTRTVATRCQANQRSTENQHSTGKDSDLLLSTCKETRKARP